MPNRDLIDAKRGAEDRLLSKSGVHGVSVGDGKIIVHVDPLKADHGAIPDSISGWPVEVREEPPPQPEQVEAPMYGDGWEQRRDEFRPVPIGVFQNRCTSAFLAHDGDDYYAMTAGHCTSNDEDRKVNQPAWGGTTAEVAGEYRRGGLPDPDDGQSHAVDGVDAAWLRVTENYTNELLGLNAVVQGPAVEVEPGDEVILVGSRSGVQHTTVDTVDGKFQLEVNTPAAGQVIVRHFGICTTTDYVSQGGDSGAAWVTPDENGNYRPAGIHFGVGGGDAYSIFTEFRAVTSFTDLNVLSGAKMIRPQDSPDTGTGGGGSGGDGGSSRRSRALTAGLALGLFFLIYVSEEDR